LKKRSILVSALGIVIPALIFVFFIPKLMNDFGLERFGFISLFWVILGVASIFDMGIARALTNYVAKYKSNQRDKLTTIWAMFIIGIAWGSLIGILSYYLLNFYFATNNNLSTELKLELISSVIFIAFTIPIVVAHSVLRGVLEGLERFSMVSISKIFTAGIAITLLLSNQWFDSTMMFVSIALLVARFLGFFLIFSFVIREVDTKFNYSSVDVKQVLFFSGWASISTFSSSIMVYLDRFVAGYFLGPLVYSVYSLASDVTMRLLFIPGAISAVLYPHVSRKNCINEISVASKKSINYILITIIPVTLIMSFFGVEILSWWLNRDFSGINLQLILLMLSIGLLFNALAHVPYAVLQGTGKVKFTAKLHLLQVVIFAPLMVICAAEFGLIGVLSIWLFRIVFDCIILSWMSLKAFKYAK
jgi:O-antigen/teichoic acid export membrane protein